MDPYAQLREAFRTGTPPESLRKPTYFASSEYAAWRFLHAWRENPEWTPDHAVLFRQLARWQPGFIGDLPRRLAELLPRAGVEMSAGSAKAEVFRPAWLHEDALPLEGIDAPPIHRRVDERLSAEPYLHLLGYSTWHSAAQKEATWTALTAPLGSTTLIALPTGSGKSLCFQALARFGTGLTVVVVPTVALAIDQWRSAHDVLSKIPSLNPRYFAADDPSSDAAVVADEVRTGRCRLIFTSPEACVSGRLRFAIEEVARQGRLEHLVIDEAHIIETWGQYFRVDFQVLSARQQQWHKTSQDRLRTLLLSATFTPDSRTVLRKFFGTRGEWREFVSQRLRPEPAYFLQPFSGSDADRLRRRAVLDCAWHLPRPGIFYTTEVQDANSLAAALREEGFERVEIFTGETPSSKRRELLRAWRDDEIDLMVATSAFGLGVDKGDVRSIVHACLPENLHRYYQEVGRGGRDGASSICVLLPTEQDEKTAQGLAPRLLGEDLIQQRWDALWQSREPEDTDNHIWRLRLDAKRIGLVGTRTWSENIRWNKRLILQLHRAGMLDLLDTEYVGGQKEDEDLNEWATVRLGFTPSSGSVGQDLSEVRKAELAVMRQGLRQMLAYAKSERPLCRLLRRLYGDDTQLVCGGCPGCRRYGYAQKKCPPLSFATGPETDSDHVIVAGVPHPERNRRAFLRLLERTIDQNIAKRFLVEPEIHEAILRLCREAFGEHSPILYRVDSLREFAPLRITREENVVVLHTKEVNRRALSFAKGERLIHLFVNDVPYLDRSRRYPLESAGARFYSTAEHWLEGGSPRVY
jgi:ATP-dependent DNA helicase RecQ